MLTWDDFNQEDTTIHQNAKVEPRTETKSVASDYPSIGNEKAPKNNQYSDNC